MNCNRKKLILTIVDIALVLIAELWVLWLCVYFAQSMPNGALGGTGEYYIFERNYLVPAQVFGITVAVTAATIILFHKFRKKALIGKKYILLLLFNIVPLWLMSVDLLDTIMK